MSALPSEFIEKSTELLTDGISVTELEAKVLAATAISSIYAGQIDLPVGADEIYDNGEWKSRRSFSGALGSLVDKGLISKDSNTYDEVLYVVSHCTHENAGLLEPFIGD